MTALRRIAAAVQVMPWQMMDKVIARHVPFVFNVGIALIVFLFSAMVGVIFSYFTTLKAARLILR